MIPYQYKVIPAPTRGLRSKGVKGADGKFAYALETVMNQMGAQGWEFQRSETLPSEERAGLTSKTTVFRNVLVFRKPLEADAPAEDPILLEPPQKGAEPQEAGPEEPQSLHDADDTDHTTEDTAPHGTDQITNAPHREGA